MLSAVIIMNAMTEKVILTDLRERIFLSLPRLCRLQMFMVHW